jgi:hypothetical protein
VRAREVEQRPLARGGDVLDVEATTEGGNLVGQRLGVERDRRPAETVAGRGKDIRLLIARLDEDQRSSAASSFCASSTLSGVGLVSAA